MLPLAGQAPREISAGGRTHLEQAAWAPDGKALFVTGWASSGPPLLRVSLDGATHLLYKGRYYIENPVPSPDGRYLAFGEMTFESNAWVIEKSNGAPVGLGGLLATHAGHVEGGHTTTTTR